MFDWDDLRHFLAVAREGSTLAAARKLQVNQSTVHRRLAALEKALRCCLVERHPTGYRLTELGHQLRSHAERIEEGISAFERHIAASDRGMIGRIRMTCSTAVGHRLMKSGLFDTFNKRHPGLKVELVMTERLLSLADGEADVAIRGGVPTDETLVGKKIANVPWALYATRSYIERNGSPKSPADLDEHTTVGFIEAMATHGAASWLRRHAPRAKICAEAGNIPSVFLAVKSGACLAPLPAPLGDGDDELLCVLGPVPELSYPMYLLTHRDLRRSPRISAFFEFCAGKLRPILSRHHT
ncbi:LysR family transcriptional regulator [Bradyrhizobium sp. GCM10027634]|uniref:LysR family transcriptional regulator n=1 Tax=unclassified Bradyrhizobium TaxID=2631580 RepID=UPI00263A4846|nr:LysR family transcriptional regulator [Bradyrhizobium sp. WYCCWR 12677]MDN5001281.1 LysR family transcriptional regulator [Bradyrhizobium sp. WYCCWR 12677]